MGIGFGAVESLFHSVQDMVRHRKSDMLSVFFVSLFIPDCKKVGGLLVIKYGISERLAESIME